MKLYTKTGDDGSTGLLGGSRVRKDDARVEAYGDVDETNVALGFAMVACGDPKTNSRLAALQSDLFSLGAELATQGGTTPTVSLDESRVAALEQWIDELCSSLPPLTGFVLPGGCELAARFHLARAVCRRAERSTVSLSAHQEVRQAALVYLNRLSDLLFALARWVNQRAGVDDIPWRSGESRANGAPSA